MSTKAELVAYVRTFLEVDSTDVPDTLFDIWGQHALDQIVDSDTRWPFLQKTYDYMTSSGVQTFDASDLSPTDMASIDSIVGPHWKLAPIEHARAMHVYPSATSVTQEPSYWSVMAGTYYLWPTPDAAYDLAITGYRTVLSWTSQTTPDLPTPFHAAIGAFLLSLAAKQQGDFELANSAENDFDKLMASLRRTYTGAPVSTPVVVNGAARVGQTLPLRGRYPWEI